MHIIGLDLSNRFPGICISNNFETYDFVSIVNTNQISNVNKQFLIELQNKCKNFYISFIEPKKADKDDEYFISERVKLLNAVALETAILAEIKKIIGNDDAILSIEGVAYGAQGNSLIDLCMSAGIIRRNLLSGVLKNQVDRMFIFSPGELKNAIGCKGNADKHEVFCKFIDDPVISEVKDGDFYKYIVANKDNHFVCRSGVIQHPFEDLFDAYLCVLNIYKIFKGK